MACVSLCVFMVPSQNSKCVKETQNISDPCSRIWATLSSNFIQYHFHVDTWNHEALENMLGCTVVYAAILCEVFVRPAALNCCLSK